MTIEYDCCHDLFYTALPQMEDGLYVINTYLDENGETSSYRAPNHNHPEVQARYKAFYDAMEQDEDSWFKAL